MVQVEGCGIAENNELDQGRNNQDHAAFLVTKKGQELFLGQAKYPYKDGVHRILFRLILIRRMNKKTENSKSAAELGRITPGMSPARKTDWRMVTK